MLTQAYPAPKWRDGLFGGGTSVQTFTLSDEESYYTCVLFPVSLTLLHSGLNKKNNLHFPALSYSTSKLWVITCRLCTSGYIRKYGETPMAQQPHHSPFPSSLFPTLPASLARPPHLSTPSLLTHWSVALSGGIPTGHIRRPTLFRLRLLLPRLSTTPCYLICRSASQVP